MNRTTVFAHFCGGVGGRELHCLFTHRRRRATAARLHLNQVRSISCSRSACSLVSSPTAAVATMGPAAGVALWLTWMFGLAFAAYIALKFWSQPVHNWDTVQDFSTPRRAATMAVHWAGGTVVMVFGPLQFLRSVRQRRPALHRWNGRLFALATVCACVGGTAFICCCGTVGGATMDVAFLVYGALFAVTTTMAVVAARRKDYVAHSEWAVRAFALAMASALYRVFVAPMFLRQSSPYSHDTTITWLNVAAWAFWPPPLLLAECIVRRRRNRRRRTSAVDRKQPLADGRADFVDPHAALLRGGEGP